MNALEHATLPARAAALATGAPPCLIVNPLSHTVARRGLAAPAIAIARAHGADVLELRQPEQIAAALDGLAARGTRELIVLAGDGTLQAIVDQLARSPAGAARPRLLALAGGRTNYIAADLGGRGDVLVQLESALTGQAAADLRVQPRHTLVIEQPPAPPRHGFFVAAAAIDRVIRSTHRYRETRADGGQSGRWGTIAALARAAWPALRGRPPFGFPQAAIEVPGQGRLEGPCRILVATTLAHERGWLRPYADRGAGVLRVTAVQAQARGFWRSLPRLVRGRFTASMSAARGYLSGRCDAFTVTGIDGYTLDGQSFDCDPARAVRFGTGVRIDFLRS